LNCELYRGVYNWNRSYRVTDPDTGLESNRYRDQSEWITQKNEAWRIVSDELWQRVHDKRVKASATHQALMSRAKGAGTGRRPKYLFSGLLACGECGSNMVLHSATDYACSLWRTGGATSRTCTNTITVPRTLVEDLLLKTIKGDLFSEAGLKAFRDEFTRVMMEEQKALTPQKAEAKAKLVEVEKTIASGVAAVMGGLFSPAVKEKLEAAEREKIRLQSILQVPTKQIDRLMTALPDLEGRFRRILDSMASVSQYEVDKARALIFGLVGSEKIKLMPTKDQRGQFFTAHLHGDYAGLIPLVFQGKIKVVAVTRIERVTRGL